MYSNMGIMFRVNCCVLFKMRNQSIKERPYPYGGDEGAAP